HRRDHRHHRPRIPARSGPAFSELQRRLKRRARAVVDADLCLDGAGADFPAGRLIPGLHQMNAWLTPRNAVVVALIAMMALLSGLFALAVGALSLRTRGVYFIMITLAFGQVVYYIANGLDRYGGDDGLTIQRRSQFGDLVNLSNKTVFYYVCLALLVGAILLV